MSVQTYLIRCYGTEVDVIRAVALHVRSLPGLVLMATRQGVIIAAFDDSMFEHVRRHGHVEFIGGVTLDPRGEAAAELHRVFTEHLAKQVGGG